MPPIVAVSLAPLIVNVLLIVAVVGRHLLIGRRTRQFEMLSARLRLPAIELVEGDGPIAPPEMDDSESKVFAALLVQYGRQLTGASRGRIVAYWESSGLLDRQLHQLQSRRPWKRAAAAFVLGDIGPLRVAPLLVELLADPERDVRAAAARSLGRLGAVEAITPLVTSSVGELLPRDVADTALVDIGPPAVESLIELTSHADAEVRTSAVRVIGLIGAAPDVGPVIDHLGDPAASVRSASASALGRLGAGEARDALVVALGDRIPDVRAAAARALGQIGGGQATAALIPIARTDSFEPAHAAARALGRIDPSIVLRLAAGHDAGPHLLEAADRVAL